MNIDQTTQDAEFCEALAATYRKSVSDKTLTAICEDQAKRYDRLAGYARKAAYTPQRELVELREENERLSANLKHATRENAQLRAAWELFGAAVKEQSAIKEVT